MSTQKKRQHFLPKNWNDDPQSAPAQVSFSVDTSSVDTSFEAQLELLHQHFQWALEIEHSTIPPYLCALYSIKDGHNSQSAQIIKSVVLEEMLHMTLVSNVLNAIGGHPSCSYKEFVPKYPTGLPHSNNSFQVQLEKFSKPAIKTFRRIELPEKHKELGIQFAITEIPKYDTIGEFYQALALELKEVAAMGDIFTGDYSRQITPDHYYGGGGEAIPVTDLDSAMKALEEIVGQGEGVDGGILDNDQAFGQFDELAHYFRFDEIYKERKYTESDSPKSGPTGAELKVDWDQVYPMQLNPKMADYPKGSELWNKTYEFNRTYMALLKELDNAMNGEPQRLLQAVTGMYDLKYKAIELMKIPFGNGEMTAGPSFEYVE